MCAQYELSGGWRQVTLTAVYICMIKRFFPHVYGVSCCLETSFVSPLMSKKEPYTTLRCIWNHLLYGVDFPLKNSRSTCSHKGTCDAAAWVLGPNHQRKFQPGDQKCTDWYRSIYSQQSLHFSLVLRVRLLKYVSCRCIFQIPSFIFFAV